MTGEEGLKEIIRDIEQIENTLDERIEELEKDQAEQGHLPGDESLARVFPSGPPSPDKRVRSS